MISITISGAKIPTLREEQALQSPNTDTADEFNILFGNISNSGNLLRSLKVRGFIGLGAVLTVLRNNLPAASIL